MAAGWTEPGHRWRLLAPENAVLIRLGRWPGGVGRALSRLRELPPGTPVIMVDHRPGGRVRSHRVAASGLITADRQYVALPSLRKAIVLAEDNGPALRWALRSLVAPPPGITWAHAPIDVGVRLLRRHPDAAAWLAAGRVIVGKRA